MPRCAVLSLCRFVLRGLAGWSTAVLPASAVWFLVCAHAARDGRCGQLGPQLLSALSGALSGSGSGEASGGAADSGDSVALLECSHLNGHRYAAICVAVDASQLTPHWYGCVRPEDAARLVSLHASSASGKSAQLQDNSTATQQWVARHKR